MRNYIASKNSIKITTFPGRDIYTSISSSSDGTTHNQIGHISVDRSTQTFDVMEGLTSVPTTTWRSRCGYFIMRN